MYAHGSEYIYKFTFVYLYVKNSIILLLFQNHIIILQLFEKVECIYVYGLYKPAVSIEFSNTIFIFCIKLFYFLSYFLLLFLTEIFCYCKLFSILFINLLFIFNLFFTLFIFPLKYMHVHIFKKKIKEIKNNIFL